MLDTQAIKREVKIEDVIKEEIEIKQEDDVSEQEEDWGEAKVRKVHACPYPNCLQTFNRPWRLECHISHHTGQRSHPCQVDGCNKAYFNSTHLRRHMLTSHQPESERADVHKYLCPDPACNMQLSNMQNLKRHYYRVHDPRHPFKCTFCGKGFTSERVWTSHTYKHSGIDCEVCQRRFTSRRDLNRHRRTNCRVFTCDVPECGQTFQRRSEFKKHFTFCHRKEYTCTECGKRFQQNCRLQTHMSVHQDRSQRAVLTCPYSGCARSYFHKRNLTYHVQCAHKKRQRQNRTKKEKDRELQKTKEEEKDADMKQENKMEDMVLHIKKEEEEDSEHIKQEAEDHDWFIAC